MALTYRQASIFVTKGRRGVDNYSTLQQPFMMKSNSTEGKVEFDTVSVNEILENIPIHTSLKRIYQTIGNPNVDYYYNDWILLSLKQVQEQYKLYQEKKQTRAIDFAMIYTGLGHCIFASYDPILNKIYYRNDGGSNGWDREINFKFAIEYIPDESKCHDLSNWLDKTINEDIFNIKTVN